MNYASANKFLLSLYLLPRREYLKNPAECAWYLTRTQFLLNLLDNPEKKIQHYIHVAGTSGKGSVSLMLGAILRAAGKRTGTITSPGINGDISRTEINGQAITKSEFAIAVTKIKKALDKYKKESTYDIPSVFEILTVLSLLYFAQGKTGWAVIETGLGGRYDSTNVIPRKDIAIITNIGLDHTELLGKTKEKIAYEKAGIIKSGCRVFTAERDNKVLRVIKKECAKNEAALTRVSLASSLPKTNDRPISTGITTRFVYGNDTFSIPALGQHQIGNAMLAIEAARALRIPLPAIKRGLARVKLPLRMEVISLRPLIIMDGAHNPDKMITTVQTVKEIKKTIKQNNSVHLVVGFSADKNIAAMIKQLSTLKPATVACARFTGNNFRAAANPAGLERQFKKLLPRARIKTFLNPRRAFSWSRSQQQKNQLLLVTGSMYLSGELRHEKYASL